MSVKHRRGSISTRVNAARTLNAPPVDNLHSLSAVHEESLRPSLPGNLSTSPSINGDKKSRYELVNDPNRSDPSISRSKTLLKSFSPDQNGTVNKETISNEKRSSTCTIQ